MKLFAKIFFCAVSLLSIGLALAGYLLISSSFENAVRREAELTQNYYHMAKFSLQASILTAGQSWKSRFNLKGMTGASDSGERAVVFGANGETLYTEFPEGVTVSLPPDVTGDSLQSRFIKIGGRDYLTVTGQVRERGLTLYLLAATDMSGAFAERQQLEQHFFLIYGATIGVGMLLMLGLSSLITRPVKRMTASAAQIASGNYGERVQVLSSDELGKLGESFNAMAVAVEEKVEQLELAARQKEDFVANFAHELKTPLTSVIGYADMLCQREFGPERVREAAEFILNEGLRLEALSHKLMELTVLERQQFTLSEFPAEELLSDAAETIRPNAEKVSITLTVVAEPACLWVEQDLFKSMVLNLLDNAIKSGGDSVALTGGRAGGDYLIQVKDNGCGIPQNEIERVTEAFYMVDKSRSRSQHGAGIGLTLVARVVTLFHGRLEIKSELGEGTTVTVRLPLREEEKHE